MYIKPESKKMTELKPAFVRSGDQGNRWRQGYIPLDAVKENFQVRVDAIPLETCHYISNWIDFFLLVQVVIEGVRGAGYVGDSAIDDVLITKGEDCLAALGRMMADTVVPGICSNFFFSLLVEINKCVSVDVSPFGPSPKWPDHKTEFPLRLLFVFLPLALFYYGRS